MEATAKLAELTSRLSSNVQANQVKVSEDAQYAWEMAVFAFSSIFTKLLNAGAFWESMEGFWPKLENPDVVEGHHRRILCLMLSLDMRVAFYQTVDFMLPAVNYLVQWAVIAPRL